MTKTGTTGRQGELNGDPRTVAFLPTEPPSLVVRAGALFVIVVVLLALFVAAVVELPETVPCPFVVVAKKSSASVVAPQVGVIETARVHDGSRVDQGQVLFALRAAAPCRESEASGAARESVDTQPVPCIVEVRAADAGVVSHMSGARAGDTVTRGQPLCSLDGTTSELEADLVVPEASLAEVAPGQPVNLLFRAFPHGRYGVKHGRVTEVGTAVDGGTFHVRASLDDLIVRTPGRTLRVQPGMSGQARIHVGRRTVVEYVFEPLRALRQNTTVEPVPDGNAHPSR